MEVSGTTPLLSVVMPVHNARPFLDESISSILSQTLGDFEFVILDDASTDGSAELLRDWLLKDRRIVLHTILQAMLAKESLRWNLATLTAIASASWGNLSSASLRVFLRSLIRTRDLLAGLRVKDGRVYEWRLE